MEEKGNAELLNTLMFPLSNRTQGTGDEGGLYPLAETFSDLIDVMDIAMWQLDRDYRVVGYNKKAKEIYGPDALGEFCYRAAAKRDTRCNNCPAKMVYDGRPSGRSEHRRIDSSGKEIFIDHIATPIRDAAGNITGSLVLIIDITRYKLQERELREHRDHLEERVITRTQELQESQENYRRLYEKTSRSEKLYRTLFNASADAIVIYNLKGEVQFLSPSFTEIFGWRMDELKGKPIPFIPESEKESSLVEIHRLIDTGKPSRNFPTKRFTKDGRRLDIYISASRYDDNDGNPMGILVILKDVTEVKSMERRLQQVQRIEALSTLAGGIAHDFNNLLMAIQGRTSLMSVELRATHPHMEHIGAIEGYIQSATQLTKQLLGLSREGKYEVQAVEINELLLRSLDMFGRTRKEISISTQLHQPSPVVGVDRGQIEQVLLNMYVNAWQAMPDGGSLQLTTQTESLDDARCKPYGIPSGDYAKVSVTDTGTGIPEANLQRIFDPFFTTKEKERGTGLGLASAYGIIKNHGGIITVSSEIGRGTTFQIYLPLTEDPAQKQSPTGTTIVRGSETVLLVDDEQMIIEVGRALLEKLGYQVVTAQSGQEAVDIVKRRGEAIDLIILDLIMPGIKGGEAFERIRKIRPRIPVILSSGYALNGQATEVLNRGCNGFIQKPFTISDLSNKIRKVLLP
ncbi:MAG: PAS domain S-box protein [Desulfobacteraceae bacterium]|nr:PAS domain S-box protein [Desulfobacteraceae bacterium]